MTDGDVVMIFFKNLPLLHEYFIMALNTIPMKELAIEFILMRLMHEVSKSKELTIEFIIMKLMHKVSKKKEKVG